MARARRFDWDNLALRIVSGAILAPAALAIVWFDPFHVSFLILISIAVSLLSYEWAVMAARAAVARVAVTMTAAVLGVVFLTYIGELWAAAAMVVFGCFAAA